MAEKQKFPIILAVLIPIVMIVLVAASIYLPRLYVHPQTDFLYYSESYYCDNYEVSKDKLVLLPSEHDGNYYDCREDPAELYIYEAATGKSRKISYETARTIPLDVNKVSPDGFEVTNSENDGSYVPFYWGGGDYDAKYLKGNGATFRIELPEGVSRYDFNFLGWIKK